ncbi:MAG: outer membrane protein assembly factor BamB family protein [Pirellulaceae bacterium]
MKCTFHWPSFTTTFAWRILLLGVPMLVGPMLVEQDAVAQVDRAEEEQVDVFLPAPRHLRQQLTRAAKALEEAHYSEAVDLLGPLLATPAVTLETNDAAIDQDYFLAESEEDGARTSLKSQAEQMLGSMIEPGRELYELKFGADARQMLEQALNDGNFPQLIEVTRRYFHTQAGYEATLLVGRYYLDQGRPLAAALRFQRLAASPGAARQYEPELSVLLATSWLLAEMPERAQETLVALKSRDPQATLRVGDKDMSLFKENGGTLAWLEQLVGPAGISAGREAIEWILFRGNPARNAESKGGFPLLTARWRVRATNHPSDEEIIRQQHEMFQDQGIPALPGLQPLAVDDVVIMRTPRRLVAVDMETGKRIWNFPWFEDPQEEVAQSEPLSGDRRLPNPYAIELNQRVWDDAPYGQMSSDGQQVFLLWKLASDFEQMSARVLPFGRQVPEGPVETNKLVALDLRAEGKLRWIVGDDDGTDEPKLAGAFFLGPPLPLMGQLYVLAELNGEIRLVVLDAATGRLQWAQQLAQVDQREITQDPTRRAAGASPSFSDGILVCPTSAGAVVAVDISTRSLLWGYQYLHMAAARRSGLSVYPAPLRQVGERWADATVTIADGRVLLTPVESDQLHCLDLLTGQPVWEPQPRDQMLFVACVDGGKALLVGVDRVQAMSLHDGSIVWATEVPSGRPSGRGIQADGAYFLPTTTGHLLKFDTQSGDLLADVEMDRALGNLVAYKDQIISHNVDWLSAYYQTEPLRALVDRRLQQTPNDVWGLARRAELLLYDGQHAAAVEALRQAYRQAPQDYAIRSSLVQTLMAALRDDFANNRQFASELESIMDQPSQRAEFYELMAVGLRKLDMVDESVNFFLKLAAVETAPPEVDTDNQRIDLVRVDPNLRVRRDRWINVNLGEILAAADEASRQRIDATVTERFEEVVKSQSFRELRHFVNYFGRHPLGARAQLQLAQILLERNQRLDAELNLIPLQEAADPTVAGTATALLADLLRAAGQLPEAAACYERLARQWGEVPVREGQTGQQVAAAALADESMQRALAPSVAWPYGKVEVAEEPRGTFPSFQSMFAIELADVTGPFPEAASLVYNRQQNSVILRDAAGNPQLQVLVGDVNKIALPNINAPAGTSAAKGHLIIVNVGTDLLALDALRESTSPEEVVLWRSDLSNSLVGTGMVQSSTNAIARPWGPTRYVYAENHHAVGSIGPITSAGFCYQRMQELTCVDPLTGETIWTRSGVASGSDIFGDQELLFVAAPNGEDAVVMRSADGPAVGPRFVGARQNRWTTIGRHVLYCQLVAQQLVVRWFDAWETQDVWKREFVKGAQCWQPARGELAVLEPTGKFILLRLTDGAVLLESQLAPEPDLARLYVLRSPDMYVVLASTHANSEDTAMTRSRPWSPLGSDLCPEINGRVYALDPRTGKPLWPTAAEVTKLCCPLDQPLESPGLVFFQNVQPSSSAALPRPPVKGAVLCMDKRDGRQILFDQDLAMIRTYAITAQPLEQTLTVHSNSKQLVLKFTDGPMEKQLPLQFKAQPPRPDVLQQAGKIAWGILEVIAKSKAGGEEPPAPPEPAVETPPPAEPPAAKTEAAK